jgi:hypothetical protein
MERYSQIFLALGRLKSLTGPADITNMKPGIEIKRYHR